MLPQDQYNELAYYTLTLADEEFIHQHVVDAFTAQQANEQTKPIALVFALAGLYLALERNYTGKQVQQAHMRMAKGPKQFPVIPIPVIRGNITIAHVLNCKSGKERNAMIMNWCRSVWETYSSAHDIIRKFTD